MPEQKEIVIEVKQITMETQVRNTNMERGDKRKINFHCLFFKIFAPPPVTTSFPKHTRTHTIGLTVNKLRWYEF